MTAFLLYPLLTAALFYLGSRATITAFLWRRYPPMLAALMDCAACSGTWYGFLVAATLGRWAGLDFLTLPATAYYTPIVVALCAMVTTPIVAHQTQQALMELGSAIAAATPEDE